MQAEGGSMATLTRREALHILGLGAIAAWPAGALAQTEAAAAPGRAGANDGGPAFPTGAVIRTLFKDYAPEELAAGATLFHEHLSLGPDFSERFRAASAAVLAAQGITPP